MLPCIISQSVQKGEPAWVTMAALGFICKTGLGGLRYRAGREKGGLQNSLRGSGTSVLGVIREQRRGGVSLAKEVDAEQQCRGRRGHMVEANGGLQASSHEKKAPRDS